MTTFFFVMSIFLFWILTIFLIMKLKTQLFFQRAYIDVKGDYAHQFLNVKYIHPKIDVQLFSNLPYKDEQGVPKDLTITRISLSFFQVLLNSNRHREGHEVLDYLVDIAKKLKVEVAAKGFY
jgi:hypothetical protein